ncbi:MULTISPECIES: Ppx/GppA phosphatase family protein [unclassified Campylobacter]|uniref:Ppx/GppA phosphatase family protein n=1 Tax=unclassified Campylobacter TaxID=2593542 RepID=UPI001DC05F33|nr:hypothetical protein [Campylobacter sp. RM9331]MBZ8005987.1 hypothetical protein [Campylobacter sp. RM9332]
MNLAIDIGSNTLKIAVFDKVLKNNEKVLNLGLFYENECINDEGIKVLINALDELNYDLSKAKVVATAIFRKSKNADLIANMLYQKYGFKLKILSQNEEARLTRLGVGISIQGDFTLVDVGGYSTEITSNDKKLLLDIGLLSFYKSVKEKNLDIKDYAYTLLNPYKNELKSYPRPIVLASKTGIFAKSIAKNIAYKDIDDLEFHNSIVNKDELYKLIDFINTNNAEKRDLMLGVNRDFAVLCGAYFIDTLFDDFEFIISAYGLKEGILLGE